MNKLTIKLKQHTPIIHFQHKQDGATLRATEVKPKLDRFILTKLGEDYTNFTEDEKEACRKLKKEELTTFEKGYACAKYRGWLVGKGEHGALNYKIKIQRLDFEVIENLPMFLGNMGKGYGEKINGIISKGSLDLIFFASDEKIIEKTRKLVVEFFALHNFGGRQTKGYGSFSVEKIEGESVIAYSYPNVSHLKFETNSSKKIFETIDYYWKRLKSGINYSSQRDRITGNIIKVENRYHKAFLFKYLENKKLGYSWEKRFVKEKFYGLLPIYNNPKFARAILGLPDKFTYTKPNYLDNEHPEYPSLQEKVIKDEINILHSEIERIASPIYFKPIINGNCVCVYILIDSKHIDALYRSSLCKTFEFKKTCKDKRTGEEREPEYSIDLPNSIINYEDLLSQYHSKELKNKFTPTDFRWSNIVKEVEIITTKIL